MAVRTGIFGSAFDPPHNAHLALAGTAKQKYGLNRLVFVPTRVPPHKQLSGDWDAVTRSLMARIAFFTDPPSDVARKLEVLPFIKKDCSGFLRSYENGYRENHDPGISVSDMEIERPDTSYTIDTLRSVLKDGKDLELYLIIGMDQAAVFDTWKEWRELPKLARICAGNRPGRDDSVVRKKFPFIDIFSIPAMDISSTMIREKLAKKESISGFVPKIIGEFLELF